MTSTDSHIRQLIVTPIAFGDPPLLNSSGVHEPLALRCVLQLVLEDGSHERGWITSAVEVACLDGQGRLTGRPVSDLLGGRVRDSVPFAAYLFYEWAEHPALDGRPAIGDGWGEALDPAGIVEQTRVMRQRYGFDSFKLKGGVFPPDEEIAAMKALAETFPGSPLRRDPNTAWTVESSWHVARELDGVVEYVEDPTPTIPGMAEVAETSPMPLATNMCVIAWERLRPAVEQNAIQVLLTDHHYWGGLRRTRELAALCEAFGRNRSEDHHGTTPSSSNSRPVGPSSGRAANRMAITAPCSGV